MGVQRDQAMREYNEKAVMYEPRRKASVETKPADNPHLGPSASRSLGKYISVSGLKSLVFCLFVCLFFRAVQVD